MTLNEPQSSDSATLPWHVFLIVVPKVGCRGNHDLGVASENLRLYLKLFISRPGNKIYLLLSPTAYLLPLCSFNFIDPSPRPI